MASNYTVHAKHADILLKKQVLTQQIWGGAWESAFHHIHPSPPGGTSASGTHTTPRAALV